MTEVKELLKRVGLIAYLFCLGLMWLNPLVGLVLIIAVVLLFGG